MSNPIGVKVWFEDEAEPAENNAAKYLSPGDDSASPRSLARYAGEQWWYTRASDEKPEETAVHVRDAAGALHEFTLEAEATVEFSIYAERDLSGN